MSGDFFVVGVLVPSSEFKTRLDNYLRRPLPPRIPPRIPRAICRPIELLAARIALFTTEVASESYRAPRGPIVGWNAAVTVPSASASNERFSPSGVEVLAATGGAPAVSVFSPALACSIS